MAASVRSFRALAPYSQPLLARAISSSPHLSSLGLFDKIKGVFTGKPSPAPGKPSPDPSKTTFSLIDYAEHMEKARRLGSFRKFEVGRCGEATISEASKKHTAVLRYLGSIDPAGENIQTSHKQDAAKNCNCTTADVENVLANYTWAKDAEKKIKKLKEEGKPMPKTFNEVQKLMGSRPLDVGRSNLAKSGQISRNALCPCGSKKRYKRCCGMI